MTDTNLINIAELDYLIDYLSKHDIHPYELRWPDEIEEYAKCESIEEEWYKYLDDRTITINGLKAKMRELNA